MVGRGLILALAGLSAGVLAGFLGIGGGTVMVPVMVAVGLSGVQAVGTSTLAIAIIALVGSLQNWRMGFLKVGPVAMLGLPALVTAYLGKEVATALPEYALLGIFGLFLLFNIYLIGIKKQVVRQAQRAETDGDSARPVPTKVSPTVARLGIGGLAGFLAGLFGVGGGVVMVPLQILLLQEPIKSAVQTSLGAIVITGLWACLWHAQAGNVQLATGLILGGVGAIGVQISTRYLPRLPDQTITVMFRLLLALLAGYFFLKAWMNYTALSV
ncbi:sulfite exporter TauE/SafE family protein [Nodosilinea sp. LEGE 07088]|uniref:sulfite exporter TauE/SafE family protein n=1 Tax=Nodosilinea sp. LEGE 07088 TaxID=2777968 RepID=UPI00187E3256|nr:sulfite exporter TauE/SafE family protein [Nodosilinea sp. LEGE 07088]MBE9138062.1 sulfite exporter TauE/SafE family protein [Nodosilinea sp. LEGE 07088]